MNGRSITVKPRGHSMAGLITDGAVVTLEPYGDSEPLVGEIVFARVRGRRYSHLVLHLILAQEPGRYLIGNSQGRPDGWVARQEIFGRAIKREPMLDCIPS